MGSADIEPLSVAHWPKIGGEKGVQEAAEEFFAPIRAPAAPATGKLYRLTSIAGPIWENAR